MSLSARQREVALLVARGLSNKEIANQLFVAEQTIKFHLTEIYQIEGVSSRAQLIVKYLKELNDQVAQSEIDAFRKIINEKG